MAKGKMIVFEGLDGSGKQTQSELFYQKLIGMNKKVMKISYPRYDNASSSLVKMYLAGEFGTDPAAVNAYAASTFFAVDRYASYKQDYEKFYKDGGFIIADRYTTSNMLHQGSKIDDSTERGKFLDWLWQLEFVLYGLPVPDYVFFLDMSLKGTKKLTNKRANKITGGEKKDIHEASENHLTRAYEIADELIERYGWIRIACMREKTIRDIEDIGRELMEIYIEKEGKI